MKNLFLVILFLCIIANSYSQDEFSIHAGPAMPTGTFASEDTKSNDTGGADLGYNLGIEYKHTLSNKGLYMFASADYMNNGFTNKTKNDMNDGVSQFTFPKYSNIPIIGGFSVEMHTSRRVYIFGSVGAGINYFSLSDMTIKNGGQTSTITFNRSNEFAFKFSTGLIINKKYTLSISYFGLGDHKITAYAVAPNGDKLTTTSPPLNVTVETITFGIRL
jgi:opacity protein-like surface antigen